MNDLQKSGKSVAFLVSSKTIVKALENACGNKISIFQNEAEFELLLQGNDTVKICYRLLYPIHFLHHGINNLTGIKIHNIMYFKLSTDEPSIYQIMSQPPTKIDFVIVIVFYSDKTDGISNGDVETMIFLSYNLIFI